MDFAEATKRLNEGRRKEYKQIGHKLTLHRLHPCSDSDIALEYFNTDILTFRADGGVIIKLNGFTDSMCTIKNLKEYLPRGWHFEKHVCRFDKGMGFAIVLTRDNQYNRLGCYPYEDEATYYETGRPDLTEMCALDALEVYGQIKAYTERVVTRYLHGEYVEEILESAVGLQDENQYPREKALGFLRREFKEETFMQLLGARELRSMGFPELESMYWKENYKSTRHNSDSEKSQVMQLERQMRGGPAVLRPSGNSPVYHAVRKGLLSWIEQFLLNNLGFSTFSTERVHRERSK